MAAAIKPTVSTTNSDESFAQVIEQQTEVIRALNSNGSQIDARVKLPVINLPIFSGEIEGWTRFSDTFTALIHNSDLSAIQKLQYLVGALTGSAAKIIESIEISAQNYEVAWNLLRNRYKDKKALKRRHLQCLFEAPKVERESAIDIQELINHFQKHLRIVKSMESTSETWADSLILYMVEEKLDRVTRRRWEESMEGRQTVTVDLLFDFLQRRVQMLDRLGSAFHREESNYRGVAANSRRGDETPRSLGRIDNSRVAGRNEASRSAGRSEARTSRNNQTVSLAVSTVIGRCFICGGSHLIYSCERFLNLSVRERIDEVKRLKLCFVYGTIILSALVERVPVDNARGGTIHCAIQNKKSLE
ncbi:uncharacterized protein LOC105422464 [Pogonomyrmex barbatus]|uniref:Uncharacterized protein LOC105422464 n=1 Tax=Pogonomyrmex barbatus TaxID=144034 RepID=A0A6I9VWE9_9HYME|nr:uncharacterized protein LOC105422464 [Pogonomyrmex barbatus]